MSSILNEYLTKRWGIIDFHNELQRLINHYNDYTGRYLFVYASDTNKTKNGVDVSLLQDDFYTIQDLLRQSDEPVIDFYIETPGGSGEAAEEIAKFLRKRFSTVNFVVAGEAKSAGTILVLSGDNIFMTDTGSLGPIDAQIRIGRSVVSAHDYQEWVTQKTKEAIKTGKMNPFDAIMIAQISPGELGSVINSLEFAKDLVKEWLEKYKFKEWTSTRSRGLAVSSGMKKKRAHEVAEKLCNHTAWRTHGRSLKIEDLQDVLQIESIDADPSLSDIVYRIKTVTRLIFDTSTAYKVFFSGDMRLAKTYTIASSSLPSAPLPMPATQQNPVERVEVEIECPNCHKNHIIPAYIGIDTDQIRQQGLPISQSVGDNEVFTCNSCNFAIDLKPAKSQIESQLGKKITFK